MVELKLKEKWLLDVIDEEEQFDDISAGSSIVLEDLINNQEDKNEENT